MPRGMLGGWDARMLGRHIAGKLGADEPGKIKDGLEVNRLKDL